MKILGPLSFIAIAGVLPAISQNIVPPQITGTETRGVGGGTSGGVQINPNRPTTPKSRYVTHMVLADARQWTSTEGKPLFGMLIAFEDLTVEVPKGEAEPVMPTPPEHPTVVQNGKIRLSIDKKIFEVPLERLSEKDRAFVEKIRVARAPAQAGSAEPGEAEGE